MFGLFEVPEGCMRFKDGFTRIKDKEDFLRYFWHKHREYAYPFHKGETGTKEEKEQYSKCLNDAYWEWLKNKEDTKA